MLTERFARPLLAPLALLSYFSPQSPLTHLPFSPYASVRGTPASKSWDGGFADYPFSVGASAAWLLALSHSPSSQHN